MGVVRTVLLGILALASIVAAVFQTTDGSLGRLLGRGAFSEGENLFSFAPEKANLIIVRNGEKSAHFTRNDQGVWWATHPWNDRMDPRAAASIVQFALGTRVVDTLPINNTVKANMREFGVENSPIDLIIKDKKEHSLARFSLGNLAPWALVPEEDKSIYPPTVYLNSDYQDNIYSKYMSHMLNVYNNVAPIFKNDKKHNLIPTIYLKTNFYQWLSNIFVVSGNITPLFKDGMRYLRDHRPLYFDPDSIKTVTINAGGNKLVLERRSPEQDWLLTQPTELKTDKMIVNNLLAILQRLTARKVSDPGDVTILEKNSPDNKTITLSFFNGNQPVTLTIFPQAKPADTETLATVSDRNAIFSIPLSAIDKQMPGVRNLPLSQKLLRAKNLASIDRLQLNAISIRISADRNSIILKKMPRMWTYSEGGSSFTPLNERQLYNMLTTLTMESVDDFATDSAVDLETYGLENPIYTLTFAFDTISPLTIFIGQGIDGQFYANIDGERTVYVLSSAYLAKLGLQPHMWKPLQLINFSTSSLQALVFTAPGEEPLVLKGNYMDDTWKASRGSQDLTSKLNTNKVQNYVEQLAHAEVRQWLPSNTPAAREALENPSHTITILLKSFTAGKDAPVYTEKIRIAPVGNSKNLFFGKCEGDSDYFLIGEETIHLFSPNIFEHEEDNL